MIYTIRGNIFRSNAEVLVNPVSCVGHIYKGFGLQVKGRYPGNFKVYQEACDNGELSLGKMLVYENTDGRTPKYIFNFPTKHHWNDISDIDNIEEGLVDLVRRTKELEIKHIVIPSFGHEFVNDEINIPVCNAFQKLNIHIDLYI